MFKKLAIAPLLFCLAIGFISAANTQEQSAPRTTNSNTRVVLPNKEISTIEAEATATLKEAKELNATKANLIDSEKRKIENLKKAEVDLSRMNNNDANNNFQILDKVGINFSWTKPTDEANNLEILENKKKIAECELKLTRRELASLGTKFTEFIKKNSDYELFLNKIEMHKTEDSQVKELKPNSPDSQQRRGIQNFISNAVTKALNFVKTNRVYQAIIAHPYVSTTLGLAVVAAGSAYAYNAYTTDNTRVAKNKAKKNN